MFCFSCQGCQKGLKKQILFLFLLTHWWMWNRIEIPLIYPSIGIVYKYVQPNIGKSFFWETPRPLASEREWLRI